jgi:hypothetical protein
MQDFNFLRDRYALFDELVSELGSDREFMLSRIILLKKRLLPPDVDNFSNPEDQKIARFLEENGVSYYIKSNISRGFAVIYLSRREKEKLKNLARNSYYGDQQI